MEPIKLLTEYFDIPQEWALVYYYLWQQGSGPIGEFYKPTGFTRQKVYTLLDKLVKNRFVSVVEYSNKGNVYKCILPEDLVNIQLHKLELRIEEKREEKENFLNQISKYSPEQGPNQSIYKQLQVDIISGDDSGELLSSLIDETLYSFKLAIHDVGMGLMSQIQPAVMRVFERSSTTVTMLLSKKNFSEGMKERMFAGQFFPAKLVKEWINTGRLNIRLSEETFQNYLLFDNINAIILFPSDHKITFSLKASVDDLSRHFLNQFENLWKKGEEFIKIK
jgi:sugar-specific transcriptional regulator TrmB